MKAYRKYFISSDLANGRFWYVPLGFLAYVLNVAVAITSYLKKSLTLSTTLFLIAALCALIHAFGTSQAIPAGLKFLKVKDDDDRTLNTTFDRFARWVLIRGIFGALQTNAVELFGIHGFIHLGIFLVLESRTFLSS